MTHPSPTLRSVESCTLCPRLTAHCAEIARVKRKAYRDQTYWGKPIAGFGDLEARLWILGLAPGAHGANRTGRVFTGDRSGEWLYRALYDHGFASKPESIGPGDGLVLQDAYISCVARCAPPDNKPTPEEITRCAPYLIEEFQHLSKVRVRIALGRLAATAWAKLYNLPPFEFAHAKEVTLPDGSTLILSYHPSQQNTFTGRLTQPMWNAIFKRAREILAT